MITHWIVVSEALKRDREVVDRDVDNGRVEDRHDRPEQDDPGDHPGLAIEGFWLGACAAMPSPRLLIVPDRWVRLPRHGPRPLGTRYGRAMDTPAVRSEVSDVAGNDGLGHHSRAPRARR